MDRNTMKFKFGVVLLGIITFFAVPFIIWNITFGFWAAYFLILLLSAGWFFYYKKAKLWLIAVFVLVGLIGYLLFLPQTTVKLNREQASYYKKIKRGQNLSIKEKWNIYGLNITMGHVALPFYHEAATQILLMHIPDRDKRRIFKSGFFLKSKKLQKVMKLKKKGHLAWNISTDYKISSPESRVALTLSPLDYEVKRYKDRVEYIMKVPVHYYTAFVVLIDYPVRIQIDERLFWYLEREGWLFPYQAIWKYTEKL